MRARSVAVMIVVWAVVGSPTPIPAQSSRARPGALSRCPRHRPV